MTNCILLILAALAVIFFVLFLKEGIERYNDNDNEISRVVVPIINKCSRGLPSYGTPCSAGADVYVNDPCPITLRPLERAIISTGIRISIPDGYECQVRPKSGLTSKHGIVVQLGTVDSDYRGEVGVILINLSNEEYTIMPNEKIGQLVISPIVQADFLEVKSLDNTLRGTGGFGSTGK